MALLCQQPRTTYKASPGDGVPGSQLAVSSSYQLTCSSVDYENVLGKSLKLWYFQCFAAAKYKHGYGLVRQRAE